MLKAKGADSGDLNGFLDVGTELEGELRFKDTFRIDGVVKGKIVSDNTLIIGEAGQIEADIECGVISIRGTVNGNIIGRERIEVLAGARVRGSLLAPKLVVEEGAFLQGKCDTSAAPTAAGPKVVPKPNSRPGRGRRQAL